MQIGKEAEGGMWFQKKTLPEHAISIQAEKKDFVQYIHTTALPEFRGGKYDFADELQKIFLFADAEHDQKETAACFLEKIQTFSMRELFRFAEAARRFWAEEYYHASNWQAWREAFCKVRHKREDFSFLSDQEYVAVLCMGTLHGNGYYRQMCIEELRNCGPGIGLYSERYGIELSPLIFYLLRVNDWVEEVRESAFAAALAEMEQADGISLVFSLPILEKLLAGGRRNRTQAETLRDQFAEKLNRMQKGPLTQADFKQIPRLEIQIRNALYRLCLTRAFLSKEQMWFLLVRESTGYGVRLLFAGIQKWYGFTDPELESCLQSKNAQVRLLALQEKYNRLQNSWPELEPMLLDKSARIRFWVRYILIRHEKKDIHAFYNAELQKAATPICLRCLGETGSDADIGLIESYLSVSDYRLEKAALLAYAEIRKEEGEDLYWVYLTGEDGRLCRAAYKIIRAYHVHYPEKRLYETFVQYRGEERERVFLNLLLRENSWKRLEYLLELVDDPQLSEEFKTEILLACAERSMYGNIDGLTGNRIREVLARKKGVLSRRLVEGILFDLKYVVR